MSDLINNDQYFYNHMYETFKLLIENDSVFNID
jgi:hypothetical protein